MTAVPDLLDRLADVVIAREASWRAHAACLDAPIEIFFPSRGEKLDEARAWCSRCPVATECLEDALDSPALHGIRAGTSERGRRALRKQRRT